MGGLETVTVSTDKLVLGRRAHSLYHVRTGPLAQVYENYWTVNEDGDVFLNGARNLSLGLEFAYSPPILWLDAPLAPERTWTSTVMVYASLEGEGEGQGPIEIPRGVFFAGDVTVPAGVFFAFGVSGTGAEVAKQVRPGIGLLGSRESDVGLRSERLGGEFGDWYSDGVGVVKLRETAEFALTHWQEPPSNATVQVSWGAVKGLFR
jgi:hypothetical protein